MKRLISLVIHLVIQLALLKNVLAAPLEDHLNLVLQDEQLTIRSLPQEQKVVAKEIIKNQLIQQLKQYQELGLYPAINKFDFEISFDVGEDYYDDGLNKLYLNVDSGSTLKNVQLNKKYAFGFELIKVVSHELSHVQLNFDHDILPGDDENIQKINKHIKTDFLLTTNGKYNTSFAFIHENYADLYGELAYLKLQNFSDDSIKKLKEDIELRSSLSQYTTKKLGINADPHDTTQILSILEKLLNVPTIKDKLRKTSGENYNRLVKAMVFNRYKEFLSSKEVIKAIDNNLEKHVNTVEDEALYKNLNLPDYIDIEKMVDNF